MKALFLKLSLLMLCFLPCRVRCTAIPDNEYEFNVITKIMTGYNNLIRPIEILPLTLRLSFKQINNLDEKNQILTSNSYFSASWGDSRLAWDPTLYGDVDNVLIQASRLWIPDLYVINTASTSGYVTIPSSQLARVDSTGYVYIVFYLSSQQTRCELTLQHFPFDSQACFIVIGKIKFM